MPTPPQFHVFLSAVSGEFRTERVQLENWLERKGLHVSSQEKFNQGDSTLWKKLHAEVGRCQAVICVIGAEPGWPSGGELPQGAPERSWTQWEFWLAWGEPPWSPPRREKVYVFFPSNLDERLKKAREVAAGAIDRVHALDLQQAHIERIKDTNKHYETFTDLDDLIKRCLVLDLPTIARIKPINLPYGSLGSLFKGRDEALEELHRQLARDENQPGIPVKHVIHGQGGVGKTRLAVEYALRYAEDYQALLFLIADKPESIRQNLAASCGPRVLNLPEQDAKEEEVRINAVLRWLQTHQGWLLIIDNVDTPEAATAVEELVGMLGNGTALITSRLADWSAEIQPQELDVLSPEAAAGFLLDRTRDRRRRLPEDETDAPALARELEGLALLLEQAGAFVSTKRSSLREYLKRWRDQDKLVREWFDARLMKYPRSAMTTWDMTIQQLSPPGRSLLQQLSWLAPEPIPRSLLPEGEQQDALAELAGFSLAKFDESGSRFRIHGLVQEVTRERQTDEDRRNALLSMGKLLRDAASYDPQDVRTWLFWDPLRSHVTALVKHADRHRITEPTSYLMGQLGLLHFTKAHHREAEPLMKRALAIDEASYGPEHPDVAIRLNNLAQLLQATNRLAEAEPLMRRTLYILLVFTHSTGHAHPHLSAAFGNYVSLLQASACDNEKILQELFLLGNEAGFDEATYRQLLATILQ